MAPNLSPSEYDEMGRAIRQAIYMVRRHCNQALLKWEDLKRTRLGYGRGATLADVYRELDLAEAAMVEARNLVVPERLANVPAVPPAVPPRV